MDNKTDLRVRAKSIRKTLDIARLSEGVCAEIRQMDIYKSSKNVLIFYPLHYEINLLGLLQDNKNFYLPKVCGNELLVCPYSDNLVKSQFNVCEPCSNPVTAEIIDLAVVPALMADKDGYRLGYGSGFYDRFLSANPKIKTIVPIANELFVDKLPREDFDVKIDYIICKEGSLN